MALLEAPLPLPPAHRLLADVQYQVINEMVEAAFYKLTDQTLQIRAYVYDVVRSTVPKLELDNVFTSKEEIASDVKEQLTKSMESFGFRILQTLVTDIEPAAKVKAAMNEINAAARLRVAAVQKAEADKLTVVKHAEADAEAKFLSGQGIARQRQAIINGLRESVKVRHYAPSCGCFRPRTAGCAGRGSAWVWAALRLLVPLGWLS